MYGRVKADVEVYKNDADSPEILRIEGIVGQLTMETEYSHGTNTTILEIIDDGRAKMRFGKKEEHVNGRCNPIACKGIERSFEKIREEKNMTVKIKKQPVEITLDELKKGEEYEKVIIHINQEKVKEVEERYGSIFHLDEKEVCNNVELDFMDNYLVKVGELSNRKIAYEFIEKIEVVEK